MSTTRKVAVAELPYGWRMVRLADVFTLEYGVSLPERKRQAGEVPVIGSAGIVGFHSESAVEGPGLVVGRKGSIGSVTWIDEAFVPIDTTYYVSPNPLCADLRWLYWVLGRENLSVLNRATGVPGLNRDDVYALRRPIPPLPEQRAIADVLDSIDEAIERTEAVIAATETLRDSLLHELLTRGVPGWHTEWKDVPGIGTIPAGWDVVRFGEVADVIMGQSPPGKYCNRDGQGVPLLNGPTEYGVEHPDPVQWTTDPKKMSRERDILFCVRGATAGRMNRADRDYAIGRGVAAIRHQAGPDYQRFIRAIIDFKMPELSAVFTGSTFPNLSYDDITGLRVSSIPIAEQRAIADVLDSSDETVGEARAERNQLQLLKASTADALLTGKLQIRK